MLYNGLEKARQDVHAAVVEMSVGNKDLQQCADAVMRLRAEYLYKKEWYTKIAFHFTNGQAARFSEWAEGYRPVVKGNNVVFSKKAQKDYSYPNFLKYMETVFTYAGTLSLSKELTPVKTLGDLQAGDVFIKGGSPGHAVIVLDVAIDKNGKKIFMLAQSYMPAQNIHVLRNMEDEALSPWYSNQFDDQLYTPEWTFDAAELKRFP